MDNGLNENNLDDKKLDDKIQRRYKELIINLSNEFPVLVLTGARQVGKTTILQNLFPDYQYISLDIPSLADLAQNNPDLFLQKYKTPLIIDEVQYAPALFRHLKVWIDQNRKLKGQIILTGSQKFSLMKEVSDSLAGRCGFCEMEGLSYFEYIDFVNKNNLKKPSILNWMTRGQYPELWIESKRNSKRYYQSYFSTYIERDIRQLINVTNLLDFEKFMKLLAARNGQVVVKAELAKDVGVKAETISNWLSVVETSNIISFLRPYYKSITKTMVKSPKVYFNDTGLLLYLLNLDEEYLIESPFVGFVWEAMIFSEFRKWKQSQSSSAEIFYYLDYNSSEIDFIIEKNQSLSLIECKWSQKPKLNPLILQLQQNKKIKIKQSCYIARNEAPLQLSEDLLSYSLEDFPFEKYF